MSLPYLRNRRPAASPVTPSANGYSECRIIRDRIVSQFPDEPAAILFTSPHERSRTTSTVLQLGLAFGELEAGDVLLVDANGGFPHLSRTFDLLDSPGLTDLFAGTTNPSLVVHEVPIPRLKLMPYGQFAAFEWRDLPSQPLVPHLAELAATFRWILVDGPAVSEPAIEPLATSCSATYLIVQLERTDRLSAEAAIERLAGWGRRPLGCVLTAAPD